MSKTEVLRVVVFQDDGFWIAQGLEHDICAQAADLNTLHERLDATLSAEIDYSRKNGKPPLEGIDPAPAHFFQMWEERSKFVETIDRDSDGRVELALCA